MKPHANALWKNIILMLLILCLLTGGFLWYASVSGEKENDVKTDMKMEGIRLALANLSAARKQSDQDFVRQLKG